MGCLVKQASLKVDINKRRSVFKFLSFLLVTFFFTHNLYAEDFKLDGLYIGVDATKNNEKIGNIDKSITLKNKTDKDRYYGYKISGNGFFVSPEIFVDDNPSALSGSEILNNTDISQERLNYGLKANIGYDFNRYFSGFLTYDVAKFSFDATQGVSGVGVTDFLNGNTVGVGSQVNISDSFGVKFLYSQQRFEGNGSEGQIQSDIIQVGTVYSF